MNALLGIWMFTSIIYHDHPQPRPNPNLIMTINFSENHNVLRYSRVNESGFCERTAEYRYDGQHLSEKVIATHPGNASYCTQDTDMNLGTETTTKMLVSPESLQMVLNLGEDTLTYVWTRTKGSPHEE